MHGNPIVGGVVQVRRSGQLTGRDNRRGRYSFVHDAPWRIVCAMGSAMSQRLSSSSTAACSGAKRNAEY
jgi:hypothetical protein